MTATFNGICVGVGLGLLLASIYAWWITRKSDPPHRWLVREQSEADISPVLQHYFTLVERGTHPPPPPVPDASSNPNTKVVEFGRARPYRVH